MSSRLAGNRPIPSSVSRSGLSRHALRCQTAMTNSSSDSTCTDSHSRHTAPTCSSDSSSSPMLARVANAVRGRVRIERRLIAEPIIRKPAAPQTGSGIPSSTLMRDSATVPQS